MHTGIHKVYITVDIFLGDENIYTGGIQTLYIHSIIIYSMK